MANLPTIDDFARPTPRPGRQVNVNAVQDTTYQSIGEGLSAVEQAFVKVKTYDDKLATEDAYNKLQQQTIDLSIGDQGFTQIKSNGVVDQPVYTDYMDRFGQAKDQIAQSLKNDNQRRMFESRASIAQQRYGADLVTHIQAQKQVYFNQVIDSGIEVEKQTAAANAVSPAVIATSIDRTNRLIDSQADYEQWPAAQRKQKKLEATTGIHGAVINNLLAAENDIAASEYYKKHKKEIAGTAYDDIERALLDSSVRRQSQDIVDDISTQDLSLQDALDKVKKETDGMVRDASIKRVHALYEEKAAQARAIHAQNKQLALQSVNETGTTDGIEPAVMASFNVAEQKALELHAKQIRNGTFVVTDEDHYQSLLKAAATPELQQQFMERNIALWDFPYLDDAKRQEMIDLQQGLRMGQANAVKKVKDIQSVNAVMDSYLDRIGIDDKATQETIKGSVSAILNKRQTLTGKEATNEDVERTISEMMIKGDIKGQFNWFADTRLYQVYGTEKQKQFVPYLAESANDISLPERLRIIDALQDSGVAVTPDAIVKLYNEMIQGAVDGQ